MSRSNDEIYQYLDKKFEELKLDLKSQFKNEIMDEIKRFIDKKDEKVVVLESQVALLQQHVSALKQQDDKMDELEQYSRRLRLRLEGIPTNDCKTSEEALNYVKSKIDEAGVEIPDAVIDRAHKIGKSYLDRESNNEVNTVIVRFTSFRYRTLFYKARKKLSNSTIRLDLTKRRLNILKKARVKVEGNNKVKFVYADINCRLKVYPVNQWWNLRKS